MNIILDKIYTELKRMKKVSSKGDFADKLKYNRTYMSELMNSDNQDIPEKLQASLQTVFGIHPTFIETNEGEIFLSTSDKIRNLANTDLPRPDRWKRLLSLPTQLFKKIPDPVSEDIETLNELRIEFERLQKELEELKKKEK